MGNLALIFHLASLISLLFLGLLIARQSRALKLWREWNSPDASRRVLVGDPVRVLRGFSQAVGADFESEVKDNAFPPKRLSLAGAFMLHRGSLIERVVVKKATNLSVCFVLRHKPSTMAEDSKVIAQELGAELLVE